MTARRRRAAALLGGVVLASCLTGCAAPGGGAGAHNAVGKCASVIGLSRTAVPGGGAPEIIRPVTVEDIGALTLAAGVPTTLPTTKAPKPAGPPPVPPPTDAAGDPIPRYCLVVVPGRFAPNSVPGAVPAGAGGDHVLVVAATRPAQVERLLITTGVPSIATPHPWWQFWKS
ncbi:hypothetical protein [Actinomycetospora chiangmaiensis]|uniref:hypothetical protein n=1 Tax=Actinomycetospora chiangmaiensis TaxID=402650 RepID=UPI00037D7573|nr:hypothetical protein [Actinomycetospora chiangmaiensis]